MSGRYSQFAVLALFSAMVGFGPWIHYGPLHTHHCPDSGMAARGPMSDIQHGACEHIDAAGRTSTNCSGFVGPLLSGDSEDSAEQCAICHFYGKKQWLLGGKLPVVDWARADAVIAASERIGYFISFTPPARGPPSAG